MQDVPVRDRPGRNEAVRACLALGLIFFLSLFLALAIGRLLPLYRCCLASIVHLFVCLSCFPIPEAIYVEVIKSIPLDHLLFRHRYKRRM